MWEDTRGKRRLMDMLKCSSEWCCNFSYLRISVRPVFPKNGEKYSSCICCLPSHFQPLCCSHSSWEIYSNQKFLSLLLIKFLVHEDESVLCNVRHECACDRFPTFSPLNSKAAYRKAFFKVKWAAAQDCWPHAALAFPSSESNQLAERAARTTAWGSSGKKWKVPFEGDSGEDAVVKTCVYGERGWASYQIATATFRDEPV